MRNLAFTHNISFDILALNYKFNQKRFIDVGFRIFFRNLYSFARKINIHFKMITSFFHVIIELPLL